MPFCDMCLPEALQCIWRNDVGRWNLHYLTESAYDTINISYGENYELYYFTAAA